MLRSLLLGPPGGGKGTQGERLAQRHDVPHLASGELLREEVARGTDLGRAVAAVMAQGGLVPDDLVTRIVLERVAGEGLLDGFVLDGFPRTVAQAEAAYEWGRANGRTFDVVLLLEVPDEELVERLLDRGVKAGRDDDTEAVIRERLVVYEENTAPLAAFYERRGILRRVDGTGSVEDVARRVDAAVADARADD